MPVSIQVLSTVWGLDICLPDFQAVCLSVCLSVCLAAYVPMSQAARVRASVSASMEFLSESASEGMGIKSKIMPHVCICACPRMMRLRVFTVY